MSPFILHVRLSEVGRKAQFNLQQSFNPYLGPQSLNPAHLPFYQAAPQSVLDNSFPESPRYQLVPARERLQLVVVMKTNSVMK